MVKAKCLKLSHWLIPVHYFIHKQWLEWNISIHYNWLDRQSRSRLLMKLCCASESRNRWSWIRREVGVNRLLLLDRGKKAHSQADSNTYNSRYFTCTLSVVLLWVTVNAKFLYFKLNKMKKQDNFLLKIQPPLEIPNKLWKRACKCNMGVILQHLVWVYRCSATNELKWFNCRKVCPYGKLSSSMLWDLLQRLVMVCSNIELFLNVDFFKCE